MDPNELDFLRFGFEPMQEAFGTKAQEFCKQLDCSGPGRRICGGMATRDLRPEDIHYANACAVLNRDAALLPPALLSDASGAPLYLYCASVFLFAVYDKKIWTVLPGPAESGPCLYSHRAAASKAAEYGARAEQALLADFLSLKALAGGQTAARREQAALHEIPGPGARNPKKTPPKL